MFDRFPDAVKSAGTLDFYDESSPDILKRWNSTGDWWESRSMHDMDSYQKINSGPIRPEIEGVYRGGKRFSGVNFASQDYLSLSSHPQIRDSAFRAIENYGVHSAGSAALMGNTALSMTLESRLAKFLHYEDCILFATGWGAGYGVVKTILRSSDHVIIDVLAHNCLQEGAKDSTAHVHLYPHLSIEAVERRLKRIRDKEPSVGILVVTETLFSMDSDIPDIRTMQMLCKTYGATLLVDCAHDLGAHGLTGRGILEEQGMVGSVDILMGSFSKSFAAIGGFVACSNKGLRFGLRGNCGPSTFTNAMSPVQAAVVLSAMDIVEAVEGVERRVRLQRNVAALRDGLRTAGFEVLGRPSAIVPVILGGMFLSRLMTRYAIEAGGIVNLVEHPAVGRKSCRWRLQVMADHTLEQIDHMIEIAKHARAKALSHIEWLARSENGTSQMP